MKQTGLGRGLDNLFLDNIEETKNTIESIKVSQIDPKSNQPRKVFEQEALAQLADSINAHGVLQPIIVREMSSGRYEIIAGERRWRASKLAGLQEIPAVIVNQSEMELAQISLVENIQREDLNPIEEAMAYSSLLTSFDMTQEQLSAQIGKSRSTIANMIRLLDLPQEVIDQINRGELSAGHARALLAIRDRGAIILLAKRIIEQNLSVRETEEMVKKATKPRKEPKEKDLEIVNYTKTLEEKITECISRKVKINPIGKKRSVTIFYEDNMDLEILLKQLCGKDFVENL